MLSTYEKLHKLADHIEKMEHSDGYSDFIGKHKFNMGTYMAFAGSTPDPACGTVACIAGETVRIFSPQWFETQPRSIKHEAEDVLGITSYDAEYLFLGKFSNSKIMSYITPAEAADAIRVVAQKYE